MEKQAKSVNWPGGARAAALITVNLDAEQFWLGMFEGAERRPKTLSMGEYGINRGLDRVLKTLSDYQVTATFFVPGMVALRHPGAIVKIMGGGHEIALHGHSHTPPHLMDRAALARDFEQGIAALKDVTGIIPTGYRAPEGEMTRDVLELAAEYGFRYSSSLYDADRPYAHEGLAGELIELPLNWALHDFPYFAFNYGPAFPIAQSRVASYERVQENYCLELDAYRHYRLLYVAQFTPQTIGSPGKIPILERLLGHMRAYNDVWFGSCGQLVERLKP